MKALPSDTHGMSFITNSFLVHLLHNTLVKTSTPADTSHQCESAWMSQFEQTPHQMSVTCLITCPASKQHVYIQNSMVKQDWTCVKTTNIMIYSSFYTTFKPCTYNKILLISFIIFTSCSILKEIYFSLWLVLWLRLFSLLLPCFRHFCVFISTKTWCQIWERNMKNI